MMKGCNRDEPPPHPAGMPLEERLKTGFLYGTRSRIQRFRDEKALSYFIILILIIILLNTIMIKSTIKIMMYL